MLLNLKSIYHLNKYEIYEIKYQPLLKTFLISTYRDEFENTYLIKISLDDINNPLVLKISLDVSNFEFDNLYSNNFYMIENRLVYKSTFNGSKKQKNTGFFNLGTEDNTYAPKPIYIDEFYRSKDYVEFIKFSKNMKYFFINDGMKIKFLEAETFKVLKIFSQNKYFSIDVFFDDSLLYLYRYLLKY